MRATFKVKEQKWTGYTKNGHIFIGHTNCTPKRAIPYKAFNYDYQQKGNLRDQLIKFLRKYVKENFNAPKI